MFQITTLAESHLQLSNVVQHLIIDEVWQRQSNNDNNTADENSDFQSLVVNNTIIITPPDDTGWYINLNTHRLTNSSWIVGINHFQGQLNPFILSQ